MKNRLLALLLLLPLAVGLACTAAGVRRESTPVAAITQEEAEALLSAKFGEKDAATGNAYSFAYVEQLTCDGQSFYRFRISWLVDGHHLSYVTDYLVSADGTDLREYLPETTTEEGVYQLISAEAAKAVMDAGTDAIILDVRSEAEFAKKHIPGAILIPDNELARRTETELPDRNRTILVYCRSGRRSAAAANALIALGYTDVRDFGGILDWPYETVTD